MTSEKSSNFEEFVTTGATAPKAMIIFGLPDVLCRKVNRSTSFSTWWIADFPTNIWGLSDHHYHQASWQLHLLVLMTTKRSLAVLATSLAWVSLFASHLDCGLAYSLSITPSFWLQWRAGLSVYLECIFSIAFHYFPSIAIPVSVVSPEFALSIDGHGVAETLPR